MQAELLFNAADGDAIALSVDAVRDQEQAESGAPLRGARRTGQQAMADARRQVVVAIGYPDLLAGDPPAALAV